MIVGEIDPFVQQMGKGEISSEFNPPDEWRYPLPGSNQEVVYKTVCDL